MAFAGNGWANGNGAADRGVNNLYAGFEGKLFPKLFNNNALQSNLPIDFVEIYEPRLRQQAAAPVAVADDNGAVAQEAPAKRGRGRPKGSGKGPKPAVTYRCRYGCDKPMVGEPALRKHMGRIHGLYSSAHVSQKTCTWCERVFDPNLKDSPCTKFACRDMSKRERALREVPAPRDEQEEADTFAYENSGPNAQGASELVVVLPGHDEAERASANIDAIKHWGNRTPEERAAVAPPVVRAAAPAAPLPAVAAQQDKGRKRAADQSFPMPAPKRPTGGAAIASRAIIGMAAAGLHRIDSGVDLTVRAEAVAGAAPYSSGANNEVDAAEMEDDDDVDSLFGEPIGDAEGALSPPSNIVDGLAAAENDLGAPQQSANDAIDNAATMAQLSALSDEEFLKVMEAQGFLASLRQQGATISTEHMFDFGRASEKAVLGLLFCMIMIHGFPKYIHLNASSFLPSPLTLMICSSPGTTSMALSSTSMPCLSSKTRPFVGRAALMLISPPLGVTSTPRSEKSRYLSGCGQSVSRETISPSTQMRAARTCASSFVLSMVPLKTSVVPFATSLMSFFRTESLISLPVAMEMYLSSTVAVTSSGLLLATHSS